jgi:hypothetical protein
MFENMMKYKKAWKKFVEWLEEKYNCLYDNELDCFYHRYDDYYSVEIKIMPMFFDKECEMAIEILLDTDCDYRFIIYEIIPQESTLHPIRKQLFLQKIKYQIPFYVETLKLACEKAFEILEERLSD